MIKRVLGRLKRLFTRRSEDEEKYSSVVMLLRVTSILSEDNMNTAAGRAFKEFKYVGEFAGRHNFVVATTVLTIESRDGFYFDPEQDKAAADTNLFARTWAEHTAWLSIDLPQSVGKPKGMRMKSYAVTLPLAEQLWNGNCTGLYFPAESITVPNIGGFNESLSWYTKNRGHATDFVAKIYGSNKGRTA